MMKFDNSDLIGDSLEPNVAVEVAPPQPESQTQTPSQVLEVDRDAQH